MQPSHQAHPHSDDSEAKYRLLRSIDAALSGAWRDYLVYNMALAIVRPLLVLLLWFAVWARVGFVGAAVVVVAIFLYVQLEVYRFLLVRRMAFGSSHHKEQWYS